MDGSAEGIQYAASEESGGLAELQQLVMSRLVEIRRRLVFAALFFVAFSIAGYAVSQPVLTALTAQHPDLIALIFLSPSEAFFSRLKLALALGFIGSFPFLLGQIWSFAGQFLSRRQRIGSFFLIPLSYGLFIAGALVAYFGMLPLALSFLLGFRSADLEPMLSVSPYISFVLVLVLPTALVFQLPVVIMFLARIGVLRPRTLASQRKYAVLLFFIIGAILTPPDFFSQVMLAIPLIILFEISLLFARLAAPRESRADEELTSGGSESSSGDSS